MRSITSEPSVVPQSLQGHFVERPCIRGQSPRLGVNSGGGCHDTSVRVRTCRTNPAAPPDGELEPECVNGQSHYKLDSNRNQQRSSPSISSSLESVDLPRSCLCPTLLNAQADDGHDDTLARSNMLATHHADFVVLSVHELSQVDEHSSAGYDTASVLFANDYESAVPSRNASRARTSRSSSPHLSRTSYDELNARSFMEPSGRASQEQSHQYSSKQFDPHDLSTSLANLDCSDHEEAVMLATRRARREANRRKRASLGSIGKRTFTESIGAYSDDEDLRPPMVTGMVEEWLAESRRLRRKPNDYIGASTPHAPIEELVIESAQERSMDGSQPGIRSSLVFTDHPVMDALAEVAMEDDEFENAANAEHEIPDVHEDIDVDSLVRELLGYG